MASTYVGAAAAVAEQINGRAQEVGAGGASKALVAGGEVATDVAETGAAKEGVDDGVYEHVPVAVAQGAAVGRDLHAANDHGAALHEPSGWASKPMPVRGLMTPSRSGRAWRPRSASATTTSEGGSHFYVVVAAGEDANLVAQGLDHGGVVGDIDLDLPVGPQEEGCPEHLGSLNGPESGAVEGAGYDAA